MVMAEMIIGRNGYGPKMYRRLLTHLFFYYVPVLARVLTQNERLKNKDAIFVCLNFYPKDSSKEFLGALQGAF